jgi:hypothetical protein
MMLARAMTLALTDGSPGLMRVLTPHQAPPVDVWARPMTSFDSIRRERRDDLVNVAMFSLSSKAFAGN